MPYYRFRLEAQDGSGHFRQGTIEAASKDEAQLALAVREQKFVNFQIDEDRAGELLEMHGGRSLDDLPKAAPLNATEEEKATFRSLPVRDRAHLNIHRQAKPYKLVELKEVKL